MRSNMVVSSLPRGRSVEDEDRAATRVGSPAANPLTISTSPLRSCAPRSPACARGRPGRVRAGRRTVAVGEHRRFGTADARRRPAGTTLRRVRVQLAVRVLHADARLDRAPCRVDDVRHVFDRAGPRQRAAEPRTSIMTSPDAQVGRVAPARRRRPAPCSARRSSAAARVALGRHLLASGATVRSTITPARRGHPERVDAVGADAQTVAVPAFCNASSASPQLGLGWSWS